MRPLLNRQLLLVLLAGVVLWAQILPSAMAQKKRHPFGRHVNRVTIPPCPDNPPEKEGYYLLLHEVDFTPENLRRHWNISGPGDDMDTCEWFFWKNKENVTVAPAHPVSSEVPGNTDVRHVKIWNTAAPSVNGCPYSAGEIKTMSVLDSSFKSYYFYGGGYVEAKIRLFQGHGQGSAMWLWSVQDPDDIDGHDPLMERNEMDIFETRGGSKRKYNLTYHWRRSGDGKKMMKIHRIRLRKRILTNWNVFGVEWNQQVIRWFVNNEMVYEINIPPADASVSSKEKMQYTPPISPFCLRFGSGADVVGPHHRVRPKKELPQCMEIAYIRVYRKEGELASPIRIFDQHPVIDGKGTSSSTSDKIIFANYYPDASYSWSSPAFEIAPFRFGKHAHQHHNKMKIWCKPGLEKGKSYPIYLKTSFPWGHIEQDECWIKIE